MFRFQECKIQHTPLRLETNWTNWGRLLHFNYQRNLHFAEEIFSLDWQCQSVRVNEAWLTSDDLPAISCWLSVRVSTAYVFSSVTSARGIIFLKMYRVTYCSFFLLASERNTREEHESGRPLRTLTFSLFQLSLGGIRKGWSSVTDFGIQASFLFYFQFCLLLSE